MRHRFALLVLPLVLVLAACTKRPAVIKTPKHSKPRLAVVQSASKMAAEALPAKKRPQTPSEWAEANFRKGDYRKAVSYLREALKEDPNSPVLWRNLGSAYAMAEDWDNALLCYERSLRRDPKDIKTIYNLSLVHDLKGSLTQAEEQARHGLQLAPEHHGLHSSLGNILADQGKEELALGEYKQALSLEPKDTVTRFNLGGLYFKRREIGLAEKEYNQVLKLNPKDLEAAQNLAAVYITQDRLEEAEKLNRWVIQQKPSDEDTLENAYFNLGIIYDKQNKIEKALDMYKLALQVAPWDAAAYVNTAVILERLERRSEALAFWEKYQRLFPASRRREEVKKRIGILKKLVQLDDVKSGKKKSKGGEKTSKSKKPSK